jgi:hypothetical protein
MRTMETLARLIIVPATVFGGFALMFHLSRVGSPEWVRRIGGPRAWKFNLWHMMAAVMLAGLFLFVFETGPSHEKLLAIALLALWGPSWFVRTWCNEFVFLMGVRDEDLPGRHDKLIWVALLLAFAPIGVWLFRSYRLAHLPSPKPMMEHDLDPEPAPGAASAQPARA